MSTDTEILYELQDLFSLQLPTKPTIYNVTLIPSQWTRVISGLTNVAAWLLYNRNKKQTLYAFVKNPSTYRTLEANDVLAEDTALTDLYCKSITADVMELEVWQYQTMNNSS